MTTHSPLDHPRRATDSRCTGTALLLGIALALSACGREPSATRRPGLSLLEVNGQPATADLVLGGQPIAPVDLDGVESVVGGSFAGG